MKHNVLIGISLIVLLCSSIASASDLTVGTGNELMKACNTDNYKTENMMWGVCLGFVEGVTAELAVLATELAPQPGNKLPTDVTTYIGAVSTGLKMMICSPSNSTREQAALVVSKFLADHPEKLN